MRISEYFELDKGQPELDFVDVPAYGDIPLYLDPYAISLQVGSWFEECHETIYGYFSLVLDSIRRGRDDRAMELLSKLREPNETHLGLSQGRPSGRGVGRLQSSEIFDRLSKSEAVRTGHLRDLADCELVIPGIARDKISDITTNITRYFLIKYTQSQCSLYGIDTMEVQSGFYWDPDNMEWRNAYEKLPVIGSQKLILIPKALVRYDLIINHRTYYNNFILHYLQTEHIEAGTSLVRTLKSGEKRVYKKDLKEIFRCSKDNIYNFSQEHPQVFEDYKDSLPQTIDFLTNDKIEDKQREPAEHDVSELIPSLQKIEPGNEQASDYHNLIVGILEAIFYPQLYRPVKEQEIHEGRKRIDIVFNNAGKEGFFGNLISIQRVHAPYIMVECKNYSSDPKNPELDQLMGRLSPRRGRFGIMVCRSVKDKNTLLKRCKDVFNDDNGYIIVLDDKDIVTLLTAKAAGNEGYISDFLDDKYRALVFDQSRS